MDYDKVLKITAKMKQAKKVTEFRKLAVALERVLNAMTPSTGQRARSAIEGQLESALELYYCKRLQPKGSVNHWTRNQRGFLRKLIGANNKFQRGYVFTNEQIEAFIHAEAAEGSINRTAY